jgi:hypothetical protein
MVRKQTWLNFKYYPGICLEGLRRTTKNLSHDSRYSGQDLNSRPPEYEVGEKLTYASSLDMYL